MTTNSPSVTTNSPSGHRFCEVCGDPADHLSAEGWCACLEHLASPKPTKRIFWFRTGERLDETGVPPSKRPLNRWNYERPFCEVCGADPGPCYSVEGWSTCDDHFRAPKPARPLFDARTGIRLGPYDDLGPHEVPPGARGNRRGEHTFCEICGNPGPYVAADGWTTCRDDIHAPRSRSKHFSSITGTPLDDNGQYPPGTDPRPSRFDHGQTYCEICGARGDVLTDDGWNTCRAHMAGERPPRRLWHWVTGNRTGPYDDLTAEEQPGEFRPPWEPNVTSERTESKWRGRFNSSVCEICGAAAGSVRDGSIVCHKHFHEDPASDVASQQHQADDPHAG